MSDFSNLLGSIKDRLAEGQHDLVVMFPNKPYRMDEVGVKFDTTDEADEFLAWAQLELEMDHFNHSDEELTLRSGWDDPDPIRFGLRLDFLRYRPDPLWRIEVMVPTGSSPLHDPVPSQQVIHTAFKVPWADFTGVCATVMERRTLLGMCDNTYGQFAYFAAGAYPNETPYFKPRSPRVDGGPK